MRASSSTGKIDNCQIGVFCAYATPAGRALIDRELYLPHAWTDDRDRARAAGIGEDVGFATKPELARGMLTRALDAGVPAGWLTADEIYGQDKRLRVWCEQVGCPPCWLPAPPTRSPPWTGGSAASAR